MDDPRTDEQLLAAAGRGDAAALGVLAGRYEPSLLGLARGLLNGREDAARDAVQDAWVRVIRSARHFAGRSAVKTWLYRIVVNRCHDLRAKPPALNGTPDRPAADPPRPDHDMLAALVNDLPPDTRLILLLCYHRGLTHTEAAGVLDIPAGTLKSRLHAALESLRARLPEEDRA